MQGKHGHDKKQAGAHDMHRTLKSGRMHSAAFCCMCNLTHPEFGMYGLVKQTALSKYPLMPWLYGTPGVHFGCCQHSVALKSRPSQAQRNLRGPAGDPRSVCRTCMPDRDLVDNRVLQLCRRTTSAADCPDRKG